MIKIVGSLVCLLLVAGAFWLGKASTTKSLEIKSQAETNRAIYNSCIDAARRLDLIEKETLFLMGIKPKTYHLALEKCKIDAIAIIDAELSLPEDKWPKWVRESGDKYNIYEMVETNFRLGKAGVLKDNPQYPGAQ